MDKIKPFLGLENCRIKFLTGEGDYEGTISRIAPEIHLLVINRLVWLPKNIKMGTLTFRANEILFFEVIGRSEAPNIKESTNYTNLYERGNQEANIFDDEIDDSSSVAESELIAMFDSKEKEYTVKLPPSLCNVLPLDNVIINEIDDEFFCAIRHFQKQDVIGLSLESPKIGRTESVHWLCLSTSCCTFLFDIQTLGDSAFTCGIKEILENPRIEKVIHDCREISDCLFHLYNTKLVNVFDTQVADYIIRRQRIKDGKVISSVSPLNSCLSNYLDIPDEFLFRPKKRSYQDELVFYRLRPLSEDLRDLFSKNVIYLRRLKQELDILLVEPLDRCTNIYMRSLRSQSDRELSLATFVPDEVPEDFLFRKIRVFRFRDHMDIPATVSSGPPYREYPNAFKDYDSYCQKNGLLDSDLEDKPV